ncbi:MAG: nitronate monooxygenase [Firmicutes bacterium]|nr:nitronate monooxygenase [Bacillota bacterium]
MKTKITELLKIEYPILQGAMAYVANAQLAAAVSNAGGLGIVSAGINEPDWVRKEIQATKKLTKKPFGVNIMLLSSHADAIADIVVEEGVRVVTTGAGSPVKHIKKWKDAGTIVIPVVASVTQAKAMERAGADAVIAEGMEAGGHVGETTTMCLVPQVVDAVTIPVIAAGGIADHRGVKASFALGAVGVQVGTRFLVAKECDIHEVYKQKVIESKDSSTIVTGRRPGLHAVRSIKTPMSRTFSQKEFDSNIPHDELEALGRGAYKMAVENGDEENGCFLCGQIAGMVTKEETCKEIILDLFKEQS